MVMLHTLAVFVNASRIITACLVSALMQTFGSLLCAIQGWCRQKVGDVLVGEQH